MSNPIATPPETSRDALAARMRQERDALAARMRQELAALLETAKSRADAAAGPKGEGFDAEWRCGYHKHHTLAIEAGLKDLRLRWPNQDLTWRTTGTHQYLFRALGRTSTSTSSMSGAISNWIAAEEKAERAAASFKAHPAADTGQGADAHAA